uniref:Uncharacterized protein n=1 Tax=Meloidogyne incognita TaxID=6306 RepID=A0A914LRQ7_MELIC
MSVIEGEERELVSVGRGVSLKSNPCFINIIEANSIIYVFVRKDVKTKFVKVTKQQDPTNFDAFIELFKRPVRVMQFNWKDPKVSDIKKNVMIRCKDEESNFGVRLTKILNSEHKEEYQSQYVRSNVCPNDEYLLMVFEDDIKVESVTRAHLYCIKVPEPELTVKL